MALSHSRVSLPTHLPRESYKDGKSRTDRQPEKDRGKEASKDSNVMISSLCKKSWK